MLKLNLTFFVRSVDIDLGRFPILRTDLPLRIQEYGLSGCTVPPNSLETKLGSSNQKASPSAWKNNSVECESFLESNSPCVLALCETNLDVSIDSGNFSVRGYLPLIQKDSTTHMHGLAVYVKKGLPFAWDLNL